MSKESRIKDLEGQVDDLIHEVFCEMNPDNLRRRAALLENFKGNTLEALRVANQNFKTQRADLNLTRELYERLGQKIKDQNALIVQGQARQALAIIAIMEHLGLEFNEEHEVVAIKKVVVKKKVTKKKISKTNVSKNVKPVSTPKKVNRRKAK